jgi:C4-dicarboxylate-specific signal transduction histidine kinase
VTAESPSSLPTVRGDRVELQQVLLNLFLNACDAMSAVPSHTRALRVSTKLDADTRIRVSVIDRGPGIPRENAGTVFEPFFTPKADGLGLGLTICRTIISEHGGQIWVDGSQSEGASVSFALPVVDRA